MRDNRPPGSVPGASDAGYVFVYHGGHEFIVQPVMAQIFTRHAQQIIEDGQAELVVLPHAGGVELLSITSMTPCQVTLSQSGAPSEILWSNTISPITGPANHPAKQDETTRQPSSTVTAINRADVRVKTHRNDAMTRKLRRA